MNRWTIFVILVIFCHVISFSQKIDTLYYDNNGKGVESQIFASYIRYVSHAENSNYKNRFRSYYVTGEIESEGEFVSIDRYDDKKSVFGISKSYYKNGNVKTDYNVENGTGKIINYYENGNKQEEFELVNGTLNGRAIIYYENGNKKEDSEYINGVQNGIAINYFENGLIHIKGNFIDGKLDGIFYQFTENGDACSQIEYKNGEYAKPYYTYSTQNGLVTKYKIADNTIYLEMPSINEKQKFYQKGDVWDYYVKNGLCLMVNASIKKEYGKYFTLYVVLTNNSVQPITFNPALITAYKKKKDKTENLNVLKADEYIAKVQRRQNWSMFFNALGESMAASKAGYSASTTKTKSSYADNRGYVGSSSSTYNTVAYNGAAAYQAELIASGRIADYNNQLLQERNIKDEGYLKTTTVNPGETISGYVNIQFKKGDELSVNIPIDSVVYPFVWNIND